MPHPDDIYISLRYFKALNILIEQGAYKSIYASAKEFGFSREAMHNTYATPEKWGIIVPWITPLVQRNGLNANWMFTGEGGDVF